MALQFGQPLFFVFDFNKKEGLGGVFRARRRDACHGLEPFDSIDNLMLEGINMEKESRMIAFGPVPSRRLGRSLGVNNTPLSFRLLSRERPGRWPRSTQRSSKKSLARLILSSGRPVFSPEGRPRSPSAAKERGEETWNLPWLHRSKSMA